jgi:hypothetical protein
MTGLIVVDATTQRIARMLDIPNLTLPEFVLGAAHRRESNRALVDAATGRELSYGELADAVREVSAGLSVRGSVPATFSRCARRTPSSSPLLCTRRHGPARSSRR